MSPHQTCLLFMRACARKCINPCISLAACLRHSIQLPYINDLMLNRTSLSTEQDFHVSCHCVYGMQLVGTLECRLLVSVPVVWVCRWHAAWQERCQALERLRVCISRKRISFRLFKQWYWESFDDDVQVRLLEFLTSKLTQVDGSAVRESQSAAVMLLLTTQRERSCSSLIRFLCCQYTIAKCILGNVRQGSSSLKCLSHLDHQHRQYSNHIHVLWLCHTGINNGLFACPGLAGRKNQICIAHGVPSHSVVCI